MSQLKVIMQNNEPWYKDGLRFKCTECGQCCTGQPGYVWVSEEEMKSMSEYLGISIKNFKKQYTRQKDNRYALIELKSKGYDCIFLENNKCSIYPVRPNQCQTFPWWVHNLKSETAWKEAAKYCEGINQEAPIVPLEVIEQTYSFNSPD